ncbi:alpha-xylosidase [Aggregatilinea lenta]|uniref:alpha-xylosidase n=1 Tax=Aggregatilinea lenta TaxID=913108 RepID=UPI000E5A9101|nr:alpha-xylosidase [Aggregatilinea lenta]
MTFKTPLIPFVSFPAELPELPVRTPGDPGGPAYVVRATVREEQPHGLVLAGTTQTGESVTITLRAVAPGIVRVLLEDAHADPDRPTLARAPSDGVPMTLDRRDGQVRLATDEIAVTIDLDPFGITFCGADGRTLLAQNASDRDAADRLSALPFGFSDVDGRRAAFHDSFTAEPDEHFYGFGEKFTDFDKRGQLMEIWQYDALGVHSERAYKNVPFFVSTRGYGLFVDSARATRFDMAASNHSLIKVAVPDTALDYYVITGPDLKHVVTRYAGLTGLPVLPPKWALGLWMSSGFSQDDTESVLARAQELRDHHIPCDVMHLDTYWQRFGRWSEMIWDADAFPDPAHLLEQLSAQGFKVCLWMNPYLSVESERFHEAAQNGYLLRRADGSPWTGDMWSGLHPEIGIIDMTHPGAVAWFQELLRPHLQIGVEVFKTDFGEGVPPDVLAYNGMTGETLHNLYPLLYNDAVAEVSAQVRGRPGFVWGRSTFTGGQRHAIQWGGDPDCTYPALASTLRGGLSIGMCGHAFWSHDIGGFHTQPTPDLFVRWAQFGLFSPASRAHGMSSRLPWDYGEEAERIVRDYVRLRYHLMPYIYTSAKVAADTSLPLIRPMVLEFPDDPVTYTMDLQYLFGPDLLVAPIYNAEGRRPVYFPEGAWIDYWTHEIIEGPQTRFVDVPLDVMPLYVRANALIPTIEPPEHFTDEPFAEVTFDAYLLDQGSVEMFDTDGITQVAAYRDGIHLDITWSSPKPQVTLRFLPLADLSSVDSVNANGQELPPVSSATVPGWSRAEDGSVLARLS